ncbi:MAG TPA: hypothetical protein VGQ59_05635 [Cyclobacteriaceae bacterium]|nr:hypothetical protein [Cyclobacteriaceae bacterium]
MDDLNILEREVLKAIVDEHAIKLPGFQEHFAKLKVKGREYTGVGLYTNFQYQSIKMAVKDIALSSKKRLLIKGLKYELSYELNLTDGKIHFLEIVTNGNESWDGQAETFELA